MSKRENSLNEIWQKINEYNKIAIFRHVNPDPDAYGAQFALAQVLLDNFPEKKIYCYGEQIERLHYLYDDCMETYSNLPEKLTKDILTITVDTANQERIDTGDVTLQQIDIKIDHHLNVDPYANLEYVNEQTPATCAILLDFFLKLQKEQKNLVLSNKVYEKLYAGIVGDTGNFSYGVGLNQAFFTNVGVIFEKIDTKKMLACFFQKTLAEITFKGYIATHIQLENTFAYVMFNSDTVKEHQVSLDYATSLVNVMSEIADIAIWASFCEDKDNQVIRCSLRSRYLDIAAVAQRFGGGGHKNAAGIRVKTWDEVAEIKQALRELL